MSEICGVDKAFRCPECGNTLSVPNSNPIAFYCSNYDCQFEKKWPQLGTERRYFGLVFQSMNETRAKRAVLKHMEQNDRGTLPDEDEK